MPSRTSVAGGEVPEMKGLHKAENPREIRSLRQAGSPRAYAKQDLCRRGCAVKNEGPYIMLKTFERLGAFVKQGVPGPMLSRTSVAGGAHSKMRGLHKREPPGPRDSLLFNASRHQRIDALQRLKSKHARRILTDVDNLAAAAEEMHHLRVMRVDAPRFPVRVAQNLVLKRRVIAGLRPGVSEVVEHHARAGIGIGLRVNQVDVVAVMLHQFNIDIAARGELIGHHRDLIV